MESPIKRIIHEHRIPDRTTNGSYARSPDRITYWFEHEDGTYSCHPFGANKSFPWPKRTSGNTQDLYVVNKILGKSQYDNWDEDTLKWIEDHAVD